MMALCMRYLSDKNDANDVLQEGFVRIFTQINQFSGAGEFGGWVRKIFVNLSLTHLRERKKFVDNNWENNFDEIESISNDWSENISADDLMECIEELPANYRTIFNLFAIEGFTHQEIAHIMTIEESTSRSGFFRARQLLQAKVKKLLKNNHAME